MPDNIEVESNILDNIELKSDNSDLIEYFESQKLEEEEKLNSLEPDTFEDDLLLQIDELKKEIVVHTEHLQNINDSFESLLFYANLTTVVFISFLILLCIYKAIKPYVTFHG